MGQSGASLLTNTLEHYGVTHVFGNPGTTELPIMEAIGEGNLQYVLALHEDIAVGMAAGYARTMLWHHNRNDSILPIGVVNLHVAPGLAHGLGNIFNAGLTGTGAPLLITAGSHALSHQHREPNLHADLVAMADPLTKWSAEIKSIDSIPEMLHRAVRVALTPPRGPVFMALPFDVMTDDTTVDPIPLGSIPAGGDGHVDDIDEARRAIGSAANVVMIAGDSIGRAGTSAVKSAVRFAESTAAAVIGEFRMAELNFPTDHDQWHGRLPDNRDEARRMLEADVVVFAGVKSNVPTNPPDFPGPMPAGVTAITISNHGWEFGKNYRSDINIFGDPGSVLDRLAREVSDQISRERLSSRRAALVDRPRSPRLPTESADTETGNRAANDDLAKGVAGAAPNALVVAEAITSAKWLHKWYSFEPEQFFKQRGGGLGYGLPAAIGAAIAEREVGSTRAVIGFIGDGAYLYYPQSIYSAARYEVDLTVVVADNRNYRVLKNNMLALFGGEESDYEFIGMDFEPPVDIPMNARSHGGSGTLVDDPTNIETAISEAMNQSGPSVVDVLIRD